ncbi:Ribokinase-like protein [Mycena vulgaris]|nr:Ribokinase-like protein [Mycena vulgaris]
MSSLAFASLGTVLIDNFLYVEADGSVQAESHLGGGGLYASAGVRLWLAAGKICTPTGGMKSDLPKALLEQLEGLCEPEKVNGDMWLWEEDEGRPMLQAEIRYEGNTRSFKYLNPRPALTPASFPSTSRIHSAQYLHFCCSPTELQTATSALISPKRPLIIYEPIPIACNPTHFPALKAVLPLVDIFSPNHEELELFFEPTEQLPASEDLHARVEAYATRFHELGSTTIIVRAGSCGSFVSNRTESLGERGARWIPPFWTPEEAVEMVKNTTGAGNSFLGGLCAGMQITGNDVFRAAMYGSVSASFVIQQAGLPTLTRSEQQGERWNGDIPGERLKRYMTWKSEV